MTLIFLAALACDVNRSEPLPEVEQIAGTGDYEYDDYEPLSNKPLRVFFHVPADANPASPVVIVLHGQGRDADTYRDDWIELADEYGYIVAAPQFRDAFYGGSNGYALGNVFIDGESPIPGTERPAEEWSYSVIEPLFDDIVSKTPTEVDEYQVFGHSAGAQFAHRFVLFVPDGRYGTVVAANAGWYTAPDDATEFPYGLGASPIEGGDPSFFGRDLVIHSGDRDTNPNSAGLRHTAEADAQGSNRFERGAWFVETGAVLAASAGEDYAWTRQIVPGVAHSGAGMAPAAAAEFAERLGL